MYSKLKTSMGCSGRLSILQAMITKHVDLADSCLLSIHVRDLKPRGATHSTHDGGVQHTYLG